MKLGLITDIHEHVDNLRDSLRWLRNDGVDQIVMIGDVYELGHRIQATCELLSAEGVIGVWGNHDMGLCVNVPEDQKVKLGSTVIRYMESLKPRLIIEDCYFAHIEPWLDPNKPEDLWFFEGPPQTAERRQQIFGAQPQRVFFAGHYHRWMIVTPDVTHPWDGTNPICLKDGRYFVVIDALMKGTFATYDTTTGWLIPNRVGQ